MLSITIGSNYITSVGVTGELTALCYISQCPQIAGDGRCLVKHRTKNRDAV